LRAHLRTPPNFQAMAIPVAIAFAVLAAIPETLH